MWNIAESCANKRVSTTFSFPKKTLDQLKMQEVKKELIAQEQKRGRSTIFHRISQLFSTHANSLEAQVTKLFHSSLTQHLLLVANSLDQTLSQHEYKASEFQSNTLYNRFYDLFERSKAAALQSKKQALTPLKNNPTSKEYVVQRNGEQYGIFKRLNPKEMAGEIGACFIGALSRLNFSQPAIPTSCYVRIGKKKERREGIFTSYEESVQGAQELLSAQGKNGRQILESIAKDRLDALIIFHLLRGSQNAHIGNTMLSLKRKDGLFTGKEEYVIDQIQEVDNESIMAPSMRSSELFSEHGEVAPLRIWWLGLSKAGEPFSKKALLHLLSLQVEEFRCLSEKLHIFSEDRVNGLITRLTTMQNIARKELKKKAPSLTPRDLYRELCYQHPTIELASLLYDDPIDAYAMIGYKSKQEIEEEAAEQLLHSA